MNSEMHKSKCETCGRMVRSFEIIHTSSETKTTLQCSECYNEHMAKYMQINFQHVDFDPIAMEDIDGISHTFEFRTHVFGENVSIEAIEIQNGRMKGYEFAVDGDAEGDMIQLFGKLFEKMRCELGRKHIEKDESTGFQITDDNIVCGHIMWDDNEDGRVPLLVIDGKEISWIEFGKMLMAYEGFKFKLEIFDRFDG